MDSEVMFIIGGDTPNSEEIQPKKEEFDHCSLS
jgi:hypothetical protein